MENKKLQYDFSDPIRDYMDISQIARNLNKYGHFEGFDCDVSYDSFDE